MKQCTACGQLKPAQAFYPSQPNRCKQCHDERARDSKERFVQRQREKRIAAAGHVMQVRMLGNSAVFVTCSCMDVQRSRWRGKRRSISARSGQTAGPWKSLGDFPVGSPAEDLRAAWEAHLGQ